MAKLIPQTLKFVDLVMKITDDTQLVLCGDCQEDMVITSIVTAELSSDPKAKSVTQNVRCPKCGGISYISLRSKI
jgi:hypothetical protein